MCNTSCYEMYVEKEETEVFYGFQLSSGIRQCSVGWYVFACIENVWMWSGCSDYILAGPGVIWRHILRRSTYPRMLVCSVVTSHYINVSERFTIQDPRARIIYSWIHSSFFRSFFSILSPRWPSFKNYINFIPTLWF